MDRWFSEKQPLNRKDFSPGITERTLALRALRQVSALFSPQPGADSSVCFGSIHSASATQISLQHRSFRLRKSDETALQTPAVPKCWQVRHAPSPLRGSRRRTVEKQPFAFREHRTPAGPSSRSAPDSALRASRGSNLHYVPVLADLAPRRDQNGATLRVSPKPGQ